jgi:hypothetical protein
MPGTVLWFHPLILAPLLCLGSTFLFCSSPFLPFSFPFSFSVLRTHCPRTWLSSTYFLSASSRAFPGVAISEISFSVPSLLGAAHPIVWFLSFTGSGRGAHVSDVICSLPQGRMPLSKLSNDRSRKPHGQPLIPSINIINLIIINYYAVLASAIRSIQLCTCSVCTVLTPFGQRTTV